MEIILRIIFWIVLAFILKSLPSKLYRFIKSELLGSNKKEAYKVIQDFGLENRVPQQSLEESLNKWTKGSFKSSKVKGFLQYFLQDHKKGIFVDWNWRPEEVLHELNHKLGADLKYKINKQKFINEGPKSIWELDCEIESDKLVLEIPSNNPELFIEKLNPFIKDTLKGKLVPYEYDGDAYGFLLLPIDKYHQLRQNPLLFP